MGTKRNKLEPRSPTEFVSFSEIGGLGEQIQQLRELIVFPLLYRTVFNNFKIRPPRGVLFHGPPGTGKTLVAGALARECSREIHTEVAFYSRKGADILDKWVGESENRLRRLFNEAAENSPSIIFFDEIDGLAPVRSARQDQVHASVVATLLALMDGLDKLSGVVVIGATNRIDSLDPALRRTGRFDRELYFPMPTYKARLEILQVHTKSWQMKPSRSFLTYLADITEGYCGSDLQGVCSEAVMCCLRRNYPNIHKTKVRLNVKSRHLKVDESDFMNARMLITPSITREVTPMRRLSPVIQPLLQKQLDTILYLLKAKSPHFLSSNFRYHIIGSARYATRLLITGDVSQGHNKYIAPAILHILEHLPAYVIDIQSLYKSSNSTAEEICVQKLTQAKQNLPSIVLAYRIDEWWDIIEESTRAVLVSLLEDLHAGLPLLVLATATENIPESLKTFFSNNSSIVYKMRNPDEEERMMFLQPIFMEKAYSKCNLPMVGSNTSINAKSGCEIPHLYFNNNQAQCDFWDNYNRYCEKLYSKNNRNTYDYKFTRHATRILSTRRKEEVPRLSKSKPQLVQMKLRKVRKNNTNHIYKHKKGKNKLSEKLKNNKININLTTNNSEEQSNEEKEEIQTFYYNNKFDPTIPEPSGLVYIKKYLEQMNTTCNDEKSNIKDTSGLNYDKNNAKKIKNFVAMTDQNDTPSSNLDKLACLYKRAVVVTTNNMTVAQLELLYDMLITCILRPDTDAQDILQNIAQILNDFETKANQDLSIEN